jgi:predicted transcriptional regulator of viral defense system
MFTTRPPPATPRWDQLYAVAASHAGYFTVRESLAAGYSSPLLQHHVRAGRVERVGRGILRLTQFPTSDHEDLVPIWLWSQQLGVFSHDTALMLHGLSDVLPSKRHLTVPRAWQRRRLRVPAGVVLHHAAISDDERNWSGPVPVTSALRTLGDCAREGLAEDLLVQAVEQGARRGLFLADEARAALGPPRAAP